MNLKNFIYLLIFLGMPTHTNASGFVLQTDCAPVLESEGYPTLEFVVVTTAAPGGPISSSTTLSIDGSDPLQEMEDGTYENDLILNSDALETPSGRLSSFFRFISLYPGDTDFEPLDEVLYYCENRARP